MSCDTEIPGAVVSEDVLGDLERGDAEEAQARPSTSSKSRKESDDTVLLKRIADTMEEQTKVLKKIEPRDAPTDRMPFMLYMWESLKTCPLQQFHGLRVTNWNILNPNDRIQLPQQHQQPQPQQQQPQQPQQQPQQPQQQPPVFPSPHQRPPPSHSAPADMYGMGQFGVGQFGGDSGGYSDGYGGGYGGGYGAGFGHGYSGGYLGQQGQSGYGQFAGVADGSSAQPGVHSGTRRPAHPASTPVSVSAAGRRSSDPSMTGYLRKTSDELLDPNLDISGLPGFVNTPAPTPAPQRDLNTPPVVMRGLPMPLSVLILTKTLMLSVHTALDPPPLLLMITSPSSLQRRRRRSARPKRRETSVESLE